MNGFSGFGNSPAKQKTINGITYPKATKKTTTKKKMSSDYVRPIGPRDEDGGFTTIVNENASGPGSEVKTTVYDGGHSGYRPAPKSPAKQKKIKNKGHMEGPIPEQNIKHQDGNEDGTWIYGRGYQGGDAKEGLAEMKDDEKRLNENKNIRPNAGTDFVRSERINDYDQRAGVIEQNDLQDDDWYLGGAKQSDSDAVKKRAAKKGAKKRKSLEKTVKTLDREAQIMRDRTDK